MAFRPLSRSSAVAALWIGLVPLARAQRVLARVPGTAAGDGFGRSIADAGDVDGDGVPDVIAGSPRPLATTSLGAAAVVSGADFRRVLVVSGDALDDHFGWAVDGPGDLDGDGRDDVLVSAYMADAGAEDAGFVRGYSGRTGEVLFELRGERAGDEFGISLASVGDLDSDGVTELAIGAWRTDYGGLDAGSVYVVSGADRRPIFRFDGTAPHERFGTSVEPAGDVDGDGVPDVVTGAVGSAAGGRNAGSASVHSGRDGSLLLVSNGRAPREHFGYALGALGDVDGDGRSDLLATARYGRDADGRRTGLARVISSATGEVRYTVFGQSEPGLFGFTAAALGDLDGDGVRDFAVSDVWDGANGTNSGSLRVFSARTGRVLYRLNGDEPGAHLGRGVARIGDVDGDGVPDLAVGAYRDSSGGHRSGSLRIVSGRGGSFTLACEPRDSAVAFDVWGPPYLSGADDFGFRIADPERVVFAWGRACAPRPFSSETCLWIAAACRGVASGEIELSLDGLRRAGFGPGELVAARFCLPATGRRSAVCRIELQP